MLGETVAERLGTLTGEQEDVEESESSASSGLSECRVDIGYNVNSIDSEWSLGRNNNPYYTPVDIIFSGL